MEPVDSTSESLDALVADFIDRWKRGEQPNVDEFAASYPQLAEQIRELLPTVQTLEGLKARVVNDPTSGTQLDDFRIVREIGRGGMGIVYEAVQVSLGRHVALKVLNHQRVTSPVLVERFRREARSVAALHHTNIVPVFGVGEAGGVSYFAMQYIEGQGLDQLLGELVALRRRSGTDSSHLAGSTSFVGGPSFLRDTPRQSFAAEVLDQAASGNGFPVAVTDTVPADTAQAIPGTIAHSSPRDYVRKVARIGQQVAEALAYAHRQGILHRDIKPSNLLVDLAGAAWVTDFGLAKVQDSDQLTETGDIIGTLRYMAPERFHGQSLPQSDIYSLGLTLYEMLTLEAPAREIDRAGMVHKIMHEAIVPPRQIDDRIPRDLETIVLKAIARDPADRFATAKDMAADLRRFLNDEPIHARPLGPAERLWRWARRNPGIASLAAAVLLLLTTLAFGSTFAAVRISAAGTLAQEKAEAEAEQRALAEASLEKAQAAEARANSAAETANREADNARTVAEFMTDIFHVTSPESRVPGTDWRWIDSKGPNDTLLATDLLARGAARVTSELTNQPEMQIALSTTIGLSYYHLGEWGRARGVFAAALDVARRTWPGPHRSKASLLNWLSCVSTGNERIAFNREALEMWSQLPGDENRSSYLMQLPQIAAGLMMQGSHAEAEKILREAISYQEQLPPHRHNYLSDALMNLGIALDNQNRRAEALPLKRRAVEVAVAHHGLGHPATCWMQRQLVDSLARERLYDEATKFEREYAQAVQLTWGSAHYEHAAANLRISGYQLAAGNLAEAERGALDSIESSRRLPRRWESIMWQAHGQVALIRVLVRQKRFAEADRAAGEIATERMEFNAQRNLEARGLARLVRKQLAAGDRGGCQAACRRIVELAGTAAFTEEPFLAVDTCCQAPDLLDNPADLLPLFDKAYKLVPDESHWLALRGAIFYRAGEYKKASDTLDPFCIVSQHFGTSYERFFLAMAHARQGKLQPARRWLKSGLEWLTANGPQADGTPPPAASDSPSPPPSGGANGQAVAADPEGFWPELRLLAAEAQAVVTEAGG